jgi:peptidoglycan/xylan/chitin deacetylase (PgdA/CDA1 family)
MSRLLILTYHRVLDGYDPLQPDELTADSFRSQMRVLARAFSPLSLAEALRRLDAGTLPRRAVTVTFDDGYLDNVRIALPILKETGVPATIFVTSGYLHGLSPFNERVIEAVRFADGPRLDLTELGLGDHDIETLDTRRRSAQQVLAALRARHPAERGPLADEIARRCGIGSLENLMMTPRDVVHAAQAGIEIGAHTVTHPTLARLTDIEVEREIYSCKHELETLLGRSIAFFAYPFGRPTSDFNGRDAAIVERAGFRAAVSTSPGVATSASHRFALPRFGPWAQQGLKFAWRMLAEGRRQEVAWAAA